jgi:aminomethyltransferase
MERAEIEDLTATWALLSLQGPLSPCALGVCYGDQITSMAMGDVRQERFDDAPVIVTRISHCGEDGFDVLVPAEKAAPLWSVLCQHRREFAVHSVGWEAFSIRQVEAGVPRWGEEMDAATVPPEARLERAISLTKGCYVGQEIIARIDARGHVNNLLTGFLVHGELPERGAEIQHEGKKVGQVRTAIQSLRLHRPIALGYLRRELQEPGTRVSAGEVELEVTPLPFVPDDAQRSAE